MKVAFLLSSAVIFLLQLQTSESLFRVSSRTWHELHKDPFNTGTTRSTFAVTEHWIEQKLDNFDPNNTKTWQMRYLENREYYKPGGPIFMYIGGEWTVSAGSISSGHLVDMAKEMNGILYYTEHRYYGKSHPTPDTSYENLKYLSVDQSLADLAHFIKFMKEQNPDMKDSGIVMAGGSYSATMVTWFRQKYPNLVNGVWASSAPLLAKVDFVEYKEVMGQSIELLGGKECYKVFEDAYSMMEQMIEKREVDRLNEELDLCPKLDVDNQLNVWNLFSELSDNVAGLVQTHSGTRIQDACKFMLDEKYKDAFEAYAAWTRSRVRGCFEYDYKAMVEEFRQTDWSAPANGAMRQWIYQTCSEYGWYQTSGSENQPFGSSFPIDLYYSLCADIYSSSLTSRIIDANARRINQFYGALDLNITNIHSTHGQIDPWSAMGLKQMLNEEAPTTIIPSVAHCGDFGSIRDGDIPELTESKLLTKKLVKKWLGLDQ